MKYIFTEFESEQFWIEVDNDGYALRQIIIDDNKAQVSCMEDCLAEGIIDENELDGNTILITQHEFDNKWNMVTIEQRNRWNILKKQYSIGNEVECKVKYYYPQGWILNVGELHGVCECNFELSPNQLIRGKVIGYDETNMWLIISEVITPKT